MIRPLAGSAAALLFACAASAQNIHTYTNSQTGSRLIPLGYPVPRAVASLTPVEGFRDHASLHARLQSLAQAHADLASHEVGRTFHDRPLHAYVVGSPGDLDREGRSKPAFFINATTHAREWAAPEVSTYLVERLMAGADDGGLVRYLLDNTRLVIIPVHNVDGLLQTQRYPDQVIIGQDPCSANVWPRDGRMRRKNMRGADELLSSFGDHLAGIDLNRNHPPFHATNVGGAPCSSPSANPASLVYHGLAPHSEPENQALRAAAALGPASRMRLGIDVHSFSRVFFSANTGRERLGAIQARLLDVLSAHHRSVPSHDRPQNGAWYQDVPDPANRGIGTAAEYFAYEWLVPAWTLELEPANSAAEYGGFGISHDGFILPASQIRRVREAWAETHLVAMYFMAGPPHLQSVRYLDPVDGAVLHERRWAFDAATGRRRLVESSAAALPAGQPLRVELVFSKPMRHRVGGVVANLPGVSGALQPSVRLMQAGVASELDTSAGSWTRSPGGYADDRFTFQFVTPAGGPFGLEVGATDMVGLRLDADPSTPADWQAGAWTGWNGSDGGEGDVGGIDGRTALSTALGSGIELVSVSPVVGEGDNVRVRLRMPGAAAELIRVVGESAAAFDLRPLTTPPPPPAGQVEWLPGESGERELLIPTPDDQLAGDDRSWIAEMALVRAGTARDLAAVEVTLLDNDRPGRPVLRALRGRDRLAAVAADGGALEVVVDADAQVGLPAAPVQRQLRVFGNAATLVGAADSHLVAIAPGGRLRIDRVEIDSAGTATLFRNDGELELRRSNVRNANAPVVDGFGTSRIERSGFVDIAPGGGAAFKGGTLVIDSSTIMDQRSHTILISAGQPGSRLHWSTLARNRYSGWVIGAPAPGELRVSGSVLPIQLSPPLITPPPPSCGANVASDGFNVSRFDSSCRFDAPGDTVEPIPDVLEGRDDTAAAPRGIAIDHGGDCPAVDQRGTPRPQAVSPGAEARCDAGAIELGVNPYRGMWIPDRAGHGIDLQTAGNRLFLLWYTYGDDGEPTAYQALAPLTGPQWRAALYRPRRGATGAIENDEVGEIGIDFDGNTEATLRWRFEGRAAGSERIRAYRFAEGEPRVEVTGTWYPPGEPGNGASVVRRGEVTAALIYYYDAAGNLRWALGSGSADDVVEMVMHSYTGFCPDCDAGQMPAQSQPAGRALFHFLTPERARVDSDLGYPGPAGGRWQRERGEFVPLNDAVDNRYPLGN